MEWVAAFLAFVPALAKIIDNPAVTKLLNAIVGLFVKTEGEKAVADFKDGIKRRKEVRGKMKEAIRNAKKSYTKDLEDIANRK